MPITENAWEQIQPGKQIIVDGAKQRWEVIDRSLESGYVFLGLIKEGADQKTTIPSIYAFVPGLGVVNDNWKSDPDFNAESASIENKN